MSYLLILRSVSLGYFVLYKPQFSELWVTWIFLCIKYSKFWSVSLEHFVERKPLISEECTCNGWNNSICCVCLFGVDSMLDYWRIFVDRNHNWKSKVGPIDLHVLQIRAEIFKLGVKIRNLKVNFKTGGTWRHVGQ